jgi:hypothetical protein
VPDTWVNISRRACQWGRADAVEGVFGGAPRPPPQPHQWMPLSPGRLRPYLHAPQAANISTVLAGQKLGIKQVDEGVWPVSFLNYDLGYIDLEQQTLQPLDNPFGPWLSSSPRCGRLPKSPGRT